MRAQPPGRRVKTSSGSTSRGPNPGGANPRSNPRAANVRSAIPRGAARRASPKRAAPKDAVPTERVQKLLAAAGIGSRREVERWIREGRLQINGEVPALGAKLAPRDRITLDGRVVRLRAAPAVREPKILLFHRSPGSP